MNFKTHSIQDPLLQLLLNAPFTITDKYVLTFWCMHY